MAAAIDPVGDTRLHKAGETPPAAPTLVFKTVLNRGHAHAIQKSLKRKADRRRSADGHLREQGEDLYLVGSRE